MNPVRSNRAKQDATHTKKTSNGVNILVINCGSSSVKYKLFDIEREKELAGGIVERVGLKGHEKAIKHILGSLTHKKRGVIKDISEIGAVGYRVVHGGEEFSNSTVITPRVIKVIKSYFKLAPLHNPPNLLGINVARKLLPGIKHVAVFDTAFHQSIPPKAYLYGIPFSFYKKDKIRRYGFHGTSHKYVALRTAAILKKPIKNLKLIVCHLGNGCSITAVKGGKSVNTSMGLTPLEGLVMGTRSGDIDPAIVFYLINKKGFSLSRVDNILNKKSGLLGMSGISSDMRDVYRALRRGNMNAKLAFDVFIDRIQKYIGAYAVAMDGLDAIVFTAGIGENHPPTRSAVCRNLSFLGVKIDPAKNNSCYGILKRTTENRTKLSPKAIFLSVREKIITTKMSKVKVLVIPTNEELMIARETFRLVK